MSAASLAIIGLANIAGSLGAGWLGQTHRMKWILFWTYGAWLGGLAIQHTGSYAWMWYADMALAAAAAIVNVPMREAVPQAAAKPV